MCDLEVQGTVLISYYLDGFKNISESNEFFKHLLQKQIKNPIEKLIQNFVHYKTSLHEFLSTHVSLGRSRTKCKFPAIFRS
jgi:hypothetical protein